VDDPSAWVAADYKNKEHEYIYTLNEDDIKEVDAAIALVEANGLRIEVRCLICTLEALCRTLHDLTDAYVER
jgi:hypothetical protein